MILTQKQKDLINEQIHIVGFCDFIEGLEDSAENKERVARLLNFYSTTYDAYTKIENDVVKSLIGDGEVEKTKSTYKLSANTPDKFILGQSYEVTATIAPDKIGDEGYSAVQFRFSTECPDGGSVKFSASDALGDYEFINNGVWGPSTGFPIRADYSATTKFDIVISGAAGDYKVKLNLVNVTDDSIIISSESTVVAVAPTEPEEEITSEVEPETDNIDPVEPAAE